MWRMFQPVWRNNNSWCLPSLALFASYYFVQWNMEQNFWKPLSYTYNRILRYVMTNHCFVFYLFKMINWYKKQLFFKLLFVGVNLAIYTHTVNFCWKIKIHVLMKATSRIVFTTNSFLLSARTYSITRE